MSGFAPAEPIGALKPYFVKSELIWKLSVKSILFPFGGTVPPVPTGIVLFDLVGVTLWIGDGVTIVGAAAVIFVPYSGRSEAHGMFSTGRQAKFPRYTIPPNTSAPVIPIETNHHLNFMKCNALDSIKKFLLAQW